MDELPIVTRLRAVTTTRNGRGLDPSQHHLTNPDGPKAADLISELAEALREIAGTGSPDFLSHSQKIAHAALAKATQ